METPQINSIPQTESNSLQQQLDGLRQLVTSVLILIIVMSGTLNIFLWRQVKYSRADLAAYREQASVALADYQRVSAPLVREFINRVNDFSKSGQGDEALTTIMKKYGLVGSGTNAPAPAAANGPGPSGTKK